LEFPRPLAQLTERPYIDQSQRGQSPMLGIDNEFLLNFQAGGFSADSVGLKMLDNDLNAVLCGRKTTIR
jgi:hypothetical protein